MIQAISLFSGIGGMELGFSYAFPTGQTIQLVEKNPFRQQVLAKNFPDIPIAPDVATYHPQVDWEYKDNLLYGGFPCKGTSSAGKREGLKNEFSSLWFEQLRIIQEAKPRYVIIENPSGIFQRGINEVLNGLRSAGYDFEIPILVTGEEVGAPQKRERVFIIAYANSVFLPQYRELSETRARLIGEYIEKVGETHPSGFQPFFSGVDDGVSKGLDFPIPINLRRSGWWLDNPFYEWFSPKGSRDRFDRVASLGDSVIPQQAAIAFLYLKDMIADCSCQNSQHASANQIPEEKVIKK